MAKVELLIRNQLGLHARACALFVKTSSKFKADIFVSRDDLEVNGKSIMGLMMLAAGQGSKLVLTCEGTDAEEALAALEKLVLTKFDEE